MKFNELKISTHKRAKRAGRGISAGLGKTAGRGTKGQHARTGFSKNPGFEGGQTPLMQRLPKLHGFKSHREKTEIIFTSQLNNFNGKTIDALLLANNNLISSPYATVKVLSKGDLKAKVNVSLPRASLTAIKQIEKAGGSFLPTSRLARPKSPDKDKN